MAKLPDDIVTIQKIKQGDTSAFESLYDKYAPAIYGVLKKILKDDESANDILQDAFVKVWTNIHDYNESKGTFFTWVLNIARNRAIDKLRSKRTTHEIRNDLSIVHNSIHPSEKMNVETIGVKDLLNKLSEEHRVILTLSYFEGLTQEEIAEKLNQPLGTIKTKMRASMQELKKMAQ